MRYTKPSGEGSPYHPAKKQRLGSRPGNGPTAFNWKRTQAEARTEIDKARADPETACRILVMFTASCRTMGSFNRERDYLIGIGIPTEFLPGARHLGRDDLT